MGKQTVNWSPPAATAKVHKMGLINSGDATD